MPDGCGPAKLGAPRAGGAVVGSGPRRRPRRRRTVARGVL